MKLIHKELFRLSMGQILRSKKFIVTLLISILPLLAGIALMIDETGESDRNGYTWDPMVEAYHFILLGTIPLIALLLSGGLLADESEDRTLTYLLVRPIDRATLYLSKILPVIMITAVLSGIQMLLFGIMRLFSYLSLGIGTELEVRNEFYQVVGLVDAGGLVAGVMAMGVLAGVLAGGLYVTIFALVSLVTTKYHFYVNLAVVLLDTLFGNVGQGSVGYFTISYHGASLMRWADVTISNEGAANPFFTIPWMILWIGMWIYIGMNGVRKKDFHVTSAAT